MGADQSFSEALICVPRASENDSTRLKLRCPDPSCNPYLAFAVMLAAGLDGIRRELPVLEATEENIYLLDKPNYSSKDVLPTSLNQALKALEEDEVARSALGVHTHEVFINVKRLEVTNWELEKYLSND